MGDTSAGLPPVTMNAAEFRAFEVPFATVAAICRHHELAPPLRVERIPKGEVSALFALWLRDGQEAVLKVYCRSQETRYLVREATALDYLRRFSDVPQPAWTRLDTRRALLDHSYILMARVGGCDGDELMPDASPARAALLLRRCGEVLARLHRTPLEAAHELLAGGVFGPEAWLERTVSHYHAAMSALRVQGWIDPLLLEAAETFWERSQTALNTPFESVLLHRDYQLWNIRVDPVRYEILALLDFDAAGLGPAESDVRDLELNLFLRRPALRREFWHGYGRPTPDGVEAERLRVSALVRALSLLAAYWGPAASVSTATLWQLLSPWTEDIEQLYSV